MKATLKIKPSDLVVWDYDHPNGIAKIAWRYSPAHVRVMDMANADAYGRPNGLDIRRGDSKVMCLIETSLNDSAYMTTRGANGRGGTRHSHHADLMAAQAAGLKWLDRRFRVEMVEG